MLNFWYAGGTNCHEYLCDVFQGTKFGKKLQCRLAICQTPVCEEAYRVRLVEHAPDLIESLFAG